MSIPNRDKSFSGSKMGVLLQRSFSTVVLLGLLAGALWWDCELGMAAHAAAFRKSLPAELELSFRSGVPRIAVLVMLHH